MDAGDGRLRLQQWIELSVLNDRISHGWIASPIRKAHGLAAHKPETALPFVPTEIGARARDAELLDDVLTDVGDEQISVSRVPAETLRIAKSIDVNLSEHTVLADKR